MRAGRAHLPAARHDAGQGGGARRVAVGDAARDGRHSQGMGRARPAMCATCLGGPGYSDARGTQSSYTTPASCAATGLATPRLVTRSCLAGRRRHRASGHCGTIKGVAALCATTLPCPMPSPLGPLFTRPAGGAPQQGPSARPPPNAQPERGALPCHAVPHLNTMPSRSPGMSASRRLHIQSAICSFR